MLEYDFPNLVSLLQLVVVAKEVASLSRIREMKKLLRNDGFSLC